MSDKIRILYVDDYELDRELVKDALEKEHGGFEVTEASGKLEFEALLKTHEFDVVLSDFNIAGFEGLQVLDIVRAHNPRIPVIIVTGTGSEEIAVKALKQGASDYVIKRPQHIRKLPQTILAAIEKQTLRDQRHKAETYLKESEKRYRSLFEKMMNGYAYCRMIFEQNEPHDFIYIDVNNAFETLTGLKNVVGKKVSEVIPGIQEADPELFDICGRVALTGIPETFEIYLESLSTWFSISVYRPEKEHFVAVFDVITDRKKSEEMLRESEERFRAIATNTPDHILIQDKHLRYVWVLNPQLGLTEKDMIGKTDFDFLSKKDAAVLTEMKKRVLGTGNPELVKVPLVSLKGETQHFEGAYIPKRDQEGKIDGLIGYFRNVTDRVKNEEALKESEERYRNILDNVLVGVYQVTLDGKFIFANQKMIEIFGYSSYAELEAIGSIAELYARQEERQKIVEEIISKGFAIKEVEFRRENGQSLWVKLHVRKTTNKEGAIIFEGLMEDVTKFKKMETQLQQAQKLEAIGTLAGGIAHDFNNILSSVIGFTELALDDVEKGTQVEDNLQDVYRAGKRAKDLIKQILTFARQADEELKPIKVSTIAKEALKLIRSTIPTTIEIRQNIESDFLIMGNTTQMHQIFMNFCTNAAHAMETDGGILEVSLEVVTIDRSATISELALKPGNYLKVIISDTGSGIPPDIISSIFEPYFTTKEIGEGTGMGLAMVHGIVKSWNGEITVESKVGKGTVFTVYLPGIENGLEAKPYTTEKLPSGTERILFVDDEPSIAKSSCLILQGLGYKVATRTSSIEALELFRSNPNDFDLVITDMTMPNMTGDRLASELIRIRADIPVILCSGYSKKISDDSATAIGIKAFAYKPVVKADLAKIVRKVLDEAKKSDS